MFKVNIFILTLTSYVPPYCYFHNWAQLRVIKYKTLLGKSEGKKLPVGPIFRWKDNIKMDMIYIKWIEMA
jgi:hypothetical protein